MQTGEALLNKSTFGAQQLATDWVDVSEAGDAAPAAGRPPRFGFDALRIPLYLAWADRRAALAPFQAFWRPYLEARKPPPAWLDVATGEAAPYALSAGGLSVANWICGAGATPGEATGDYYSDVLAALVWLARSDNKALAWSTMRSGAA